MKSYSPTIEPGDVIEASRNTGVGIVRYDDARQVESFLTELQRTASYSQRSALSVAESLYRQMRQYGDHPEIASYIFRDMLEKEQGLIIAHWQDIAQREATCEEILHSSMSMRNTPLPIIITVSSQCRYVFPPVLQDAIFTLE